MMAEYYKLVGKEAIPFPCFEDYLDFLKTQTSEERNETRRVALTEAKNGFRISTVFMSLSHQYGAGPPLIFETMVFDGDNYSDLDCDRYSTWEEAEAGHKKMVYSWSRKQRAAIKD